MPVVATLGNHDYYGNSIDWALDFVRKQTAGTDVHVLENDTFEIDGLRVIGATLWTDFEVPFGAPDGAEELPVDERRDLAFHVCLREIMDFSEIYRSDERKPGEIGLITIQEMIARHRQSRAFIQAELGRPFDGKTMVLSHHAPSPRSLHPNFVGFPSNAAFASDLTAVIQKGRRWYWVHGHVHHFWIISKTKPASFATQEGISMSGRTTGFGPAT